MMGNGDIFIILGVGVMVVCFLWLYKIAFTTRGTTFGLVGIFAPIILLVLLADKEGRKAWIINVLGYGIVLIGQVINAASY